MMASKASKALIASAFCTGFASGQQTLYTWHGEFRQDRLGVDVASAGDVDADGHADLLVSGIGFTVEGRLDLRSGFDGSLIRSYEGVDDFTRVRGVSVGRLDGDNRDDFVVGYDRARGDCGSRQGRVDSHLDPGSVASARWGEKCDDFYGASLANAGDIDADGTPDLIVGAPRHTPFAPFQAGKVYVYSGLQEEPVYTYIGRQSSDLLGLVVATAGDFNADGFDDFCFWGTAFVDGANSPRVEVYSGKTGEMLERFTGTLLDNFGPAIASVDDVDGDGYDDIAVGADGYDNFRGKVYIYSGRTRGILAELIGINQDPSSFGNAIARAGDVNGDGWTDLVVGAPFDLQPNRGAAYLYSGRTLRLLYAFVPDDRNSLFGDSVAGAGDVNGDGLHDIIVGAPNYNSLATSGRDEGRVYVFAGNDLYLQASRTTLIPGDRLLLHTRGGEPLASAFLFLTEINGTPVPIQLVAGGTLDKHGEWTHKLVIPEEYVGLDLTFQSFSQQPVRQPPSGSWSNGHGQGIPPSDLRGLHPWKAADSAPERVSVREEGELFSPAGTEELSDAPLRQTLR